MSELRIFEVDEPVRISRPVPHCVTVRFAGFPELGWRCKHEGCDAEWDELPPVDERLRGCGG